MATDRGLRAMNAALRRLLRIAVVASLPCATAHAQTDVRAWSAAGQVFVVWKVDSTAPLTYDIYRSISPVTSTSQATLAGRAFQPEWPGDRLKLVSPNATWRVPAASGGTYQLASNEGLFVYTPRAAGMEHFAVVRNGSTAISDTNRTQTAVVVSYDPANQPIRCHLQRSGTSSRGYPCKT